MKLMHIGDRNMDARHLEAFRNGDRNAMERVYRAHVDEVEALVRFGLGRAGQLSPANLADLVQEIFAKAFSRKARAAYDGTREYGPFLKQLARNALIDWLRSRRAEVIPNLDELPEASQVGAEDFAFPAEIIAMTRRFVAELDPALRAVHEARFLEAESQEQAAHRLGITRQKLRTLERKLLTGLRQALRAADRTEAALPFFQPKAGPKPY